MQIHRYYIIILFKSPTTLIKEYGGSDTLMVSGGKIIVLLWCRSKKNMVNLGTFKCKDRNDIKFENMNVLYTLKSMHGLGWCSHWKTLTAIITSNVNIKEVKMHWSLLV